VVLYRQGDDDALFRAYRGSRDPELRRRLVERWLPLARQLAAHYRVRDESYEDLLQVASLGLLKAINGYDADRGIAFTSYAVPTILGELRRHFRDRAWSVRVPRALQELALDVEKASHRLTTALGRAPTIGELARELETTEERVLEARQAGDAYSATSLETQRGDDPDAPTLGDTLGAFDGGFHAAEDRATLTTLLVSISERDREILRLRFEEDLTQTQIADIVGVSQMAVSRIIRRSIDRMRLAA
jgi:RNA polymerase sigma-B factor